LCHRSIGVWCEATGYAVSSKEREERCARVAADTSQKVTEILNDVFKGKPVAAGLPATTTSCLSCHGKDGELDNAKVKMNCSVCHDDKLTDHP
jgi:cytochrome c553